MAVGAYNIALCGFLQEATIRPGMCAMTVHATRRNIQQFRCRVLLDIGPGHVVEHIFPENQRWRRSSDPSLAALQSPTVYCQREAMTVSSTDAPPQAGMVWIPGGTFRMGSELEGYPEEGPIRSVSVDGFWMDAHQVTVAEFRDFVLDTGYKTVASRALDPAAYPGVDPKNLVPGSLVFQKAKAPVDIPAALKCATLPWWKYVPGADWRRPEGAGSHVGGRADHPVVHVCWEDVNAYAAWAGKAIPTEAEWEFAARGGLDGAIYTWGDDPTPDGQVMANTWQGEFPWQNLLLDGYEGTAPVGSFAANGYGLYDMAGNVWEWTCDYYTPRHEIEEAEHPCCTPLNPRVASPESSYDGSDARAARMPRRVIKGGSHLCAPNYCLRYRPAARQPQMEDSSMSHIGFRCIVRPGDF